MSGYDDIRRPQAELIADCVHCGFCLPTCPTYTLWGEEMDSPRGRIVLIAEGGEEISEPLVTHLDRCLGCMACVTACPSGVRYDLLLEDARAQVERGVSRPRSERVARALTFGLFTRPGRMRALAPGAAAARRIGLPRLARRAQERGLVPRLSAAVSMTPPASTREALRPLPRLYEAHGESRGVVALLPRSSANAPPYRSKYSILMSYFRPATRSMLPLCSAALCGTHLSMINCPSTHSENSIIRAMAPRCTTTSFNAGERPVSRPSCTTRASSRK